jgi:hypothetical protein
MSEKQQLGPLQTAWIEALRSGKYRQQRSGGMYDPETDSHCCLNVARVALGLGGANDGYLDQDETDKLRLYSRPGSPKALGGSLAALNDLGSTFTEIADLLEADPANWFSGPA